MMHAPIRFVPSVRFDTLLVHRAHPGLHTPPTTTAGGVIRARLAQLLSLYVTPCLSVSKAGRSSVPREVEESWHTAEDAISPEDLRAHEAPTFAVGGIPVDPPPRRFCA